MAGGEFTCTQKAFGEEEPIGTIIIDRIDYTKEMTFGDRIECLIKNLPEKLSEKLGLKE